MYKIVTTPDPVLVKKVGKVTRFDKRSLRSSAGIAGPAGLKNLHETLEEMKETLIATTDPVGVGLAAPQVGLPLAIFQMKPTDNSPVISFINPKIISGSVDEEIPAHKNSNKIEKKKPRKGKLLEGCLSIPNIWGHVTRKKEVTISWQDENGKTHKKLFKGFSAVIIQHEMDHLQGILFTKHVIEQNEKLYKSHKNSEDEDVFDEIKL